MNFLWFLIVGLVAGWLAGVLVKGGGFGLIGDLIVGVLGAFLGGFLFSSFGASSGGGLMAASSSQPSARLCYSSSCGY